MSKKSNGHQYNTGYMAGKLKVIRKIGKKCKWSLFPAQYKYISGLVIV